MTTETDQSRGDYEIPLTTCDQMAWPYLGPANEKKDRTEHIMQIFVWYMTYYGIDTVFITLLVIVSPIHRLTWKSMVNCRTEPVNKTSKIVRQLEFESKLDWHAVKPVYPDHL